MHCLSPTETVGVIRLITLAGDVLIISLSAHIIHTEYRERHPSKRELRRRAEAREDERRAVLHKLMHG